MRISRVYNIPHIILLSVSIASLTYLDSCALVPSRPEDGGVQETIVAVHSPAPTHSAIPSTPLTPIRAATDTQTQRLDQRCPEGLPIPKQTICAEIFSNRKLYALTPIPITPDPNEIHKFFEPPPTDNYLELVDPYQTPAGNGFLTYHHGGSWAFQMKMFIGHGPAWAKEDLEDYILVFAGVDINEKEQGVLTVERPFLNSDWYEQRWIDTPTKHGAVWIVGAAGDRLILDSEDGTILYFDLPSAMFVSSLDEIVPTMTPAPTFTPAPTSTIFDDVWDLPSMAGFSDGYRPFNTELVYKIEKPGDEDWFLFELQSPGSVAISISDLHANYAFRVWRESSMDVIGRSDTKYANRKVVYFDQLPKDVYAVVVYGVDDAHDVINPYILRFQID